MLLFVSFLLSPFAAAGLGPPNIHVRIKHNICFVRLAAAATAAAAAAAAAAVPKLLLLLLLLL